tara:strand:+ start:381 stop:593 length:213 start_codon:yes stop_codon:yes gene_type:complete
MIAFNIAGGGSRVRINASTPFSIPDINAIGMAHNWHVITDQVKNSMVRHCIFHYQKQSSVFFDLIHYMNN